MLDVLDSGRANVSLTSVTEYSSSYNSILTHWFFGSGYDNMGLLYVAILIRHIVRLNPDLTLNVLLEH